MLTDARACAGASANGKIADSTALLDGAPKGRSSSHSELDIVLPITFFENKLPNRVKIVSI